LEYFMQMLLTVVTSLITALITLGVSKHQASKSAKLLLIEHLLFTKQSVQNLQYLGGRTTADIDKELIEVRNKYNAILFGQYAYLKNYTDNVNKTRNSLNKLYAIAFSAVQNMKSNNPALVTQSSQQINELKVKCGETEKDIDNFIAILQ